MSAKKPEQDGEDGKEAVTELELRAREVDIAKREANIAEKRLDHEIETASKENRWLSPLVLALLGAALAAGGNALVSLINGEQDRALERVKAEHARIHAMIETGDPDAASENLSFLLETGLISDPAIRKGLETYLQRPRPPGTGVSLPSQRQLEPPGIAREITTRQLLAMQITDAMQRVDICTGNPAVSRGLLNASVLRCLQDYFDATEEELDQLMTDAPGLLLSWIETGTPPLDWRAQAGIE